MYGVCAGTEKTAGRGGEDPTGRTTKEATGNSTIVTMLMLGPVLLESPKVRCNTRTKDRRNTISTVVLKSLLISSGTRAEEAAGGHAEGAGEFLVLKRTVLRQSFHRCRLA